MSANPHPFELLTPDFLLSAVESQGWVCDGRILVLNSYENRVYQIGIEQDVEPKAPLVAKFYRPQRWSREQILEEHNFCFELQEQELPVVAPVRNGDGQSLFDYGGFMFALYPCKGGYAPELENPEHLFSLGRLLARIHSIGAVRPFQYRPALDRQSYGHESVALISEGFIPRDLRLSYDTLTRDLLQAIEQVFAGASSVKWIRAHSDCHPGNILWRDDAAHFVDFDDARMAPAVQDIWMLLSGDRTQQTAQLAEIIEGYSEFYDFYPGELTLIEALRTLRMLHYSAWLARRWEDPAFPRAFPWFNTQRYWSEHILELREQLAALQEPPLVLA